MVASLFHPLNIFVLGLAGGFAIPLLVRIGTAWLSAGFFIALVGIAVISAVSLLRILGGEPPIDILTAGSLPPISISLRFGLSEGFVAASVNVVAVLGALHLWDRLRGNYAALLLYLGLTMGINGMVMTRDLFNLFVFLEIVSIATYGLLGLERTPAALGAAFKFIMATVIASSFFLLGTGLLYYVTGTLSIDDPDCRQVRHHRANRRGRAASPACLPRHRAEAVSPPMAGASTSMRPRRAASPR